MILGASSAEAVHAWPADEAEVLPVDTEVLIDHPIQMQLGKSEGALVGGLFLDPGKGGYLMSVSG